MSVYKPKNSTIYLYDFQHRGRRFHGSTGQKTKREAERVETRKRAEAALDIKHRKPITMWPVTWPALCHRSPNDTVLSTPFSCQSAKRLSREPAGYGCLRCTAVLPIVIDDSKRGALTCLS